MRILNFGPLWIRIQIRIQGYVINFKPEENNVPGRTLFVIRVSEW